MSRRHLESGRIAEFCAHRGTQQELWESKRKEKNLLNSLYFELKKRTKSMFFEGKKCHSFEADNLYLSYVIKCDKLAF